MIVTIYIFSLNPPHITSEDRRSVNIKEPRLANGRGLEIFSPTLAATGAKSGSDPRAAHYETVLQDVGRRGEEDARGGDINAHTIQAGQPGTEPLCVTAQ